MRCQATTFTSREYIPGLYGRVTEHIKRRHRGVCIPLILDYVLIVCLAKLNTTSPLRTSYSRKSRPHIDIADSPYDADPNVHDSLSSDSPDSPYTTPDRRRLPWIKCRSTILDFGEENVKEMVRHAGRKSVEPRTFDRKCARDVSVLHLYRDVGHGPVLC